jgi:MFS family permease
MDAIQLERATSRRYYLATVFQGIWTTGQYLFPFVLAKSLGAPGWLVTLSVVLETSGMTLGLYWSQLMAGGGRRRWLLWSGIGGRLVLIAALLVHTASAFVVLLAVVYFFISVVFPAQNSILQDNIRPHRRGTVFGRGALVQHLTAAVASVAVGAVLQRDPDLFRWVYPVIGILGFGFPLILSRLPRPETGALAGSGAAVVSITPGEPAVVDAAAWRRLINALTAPFREAGETFRHDRAFFWYETNFSIYGVAFIMLSPVVPLYFTEVWRLSYQDITMARVLITSLGVALLGPPAGRLMDVIHPARLCALAFGWLALFPLLLAFGPLVLPLAPVGAAYLAFVVFSVGMAGVHVGWNVGSIAFAPPGKGGHYQGIHVAMVGIRGVLAPVLGYVLLRWLGYRAVFLTAAVLFLAASASSMLLGRRLAKGRR